jgi:hypothetical protein
MNMKRVLGVAGAAALITMTGCSETIEDTLLDNGASVEITGIGDDGLVDGTVESPSAITAMDISVEKSDGSEAAIGVEYFDLVPLAEQLEMDLTSFVLGMDTEESIGAELYLTNMCDGDYNLVVTIENDDGEASVEAAFSITDEGECEVGTSSEESSSATLEIGPAETYTLGAQDASEPSALDLDAGEIYSSSERVAHAAELDLAYGHQTDGGYIMTPARAEAANFGDWGGDEAGDPLIYDVSSLVSGDVADMTEFPALNDLDFGAFVDEIAVENGLVLLVVTDTEGNFLVQVNDVVDGAAGSVTVLARENASED